MAIAQKTKIRRNALCHCGSGKKYKKCCEKKENTIMDNQTKIETPPKLKNEFRDEVQDPYASIPEAELVTRDQAVLLKELRFNKYVTNLNKESATKAIDAAMALVIELSGMPKSPYREMCMENLKQSIKNNKDQLKTIGFPLSKELNLRALEELFAEPETELATDASASTQADTAEDSEAEEELTIPEDSEGPGEGVDDEDNPEEAI